MHQLAAESIQKTKGVKPKSAMREVWNVISKMVEAEAERRIPVTEVLKKFEAIKLK